jgi:signal transduction histidine kinase
MDLMNLTDFKKVSDGIKVNVGSNIHMKELISMGDILQQTNILIVDDMPKNHIGFKAILEELNQNLIFANSAEEALRQILLHDFSVILLDVQMPDMNGFETARLIRMREKSSYTPIIFLSAYNQSEIDVSQGYEMGAVDYILKPINALVLRSKVKVFVDLFTKSTLAINLQNELKRRLNAEQRSRKQQRRLELAETDRLRTIEEVSSALAHELNQPLAAIRNYVQGCINRLSNTNYKVEELVMALQHASHQAERAGAILHRIKNFVRKGKLYYEPVFINELIPNLVFLMQDLIDESGLHLQLKLSKKPLPKMFLDKIQIEQVILNLLRNGMEVLKSYSQQNKPELIIETLLDEKKKKLIIRVKDNGPGISDENMLKIFELYYSTKLNGMGIGLSICRTIIEAHGGQISVNNNPTGGACFQLALPILTSSPDAA